MNHPAPGLFLMACGSAEPLRVGVGPKDEMHSETWTFPQPFVVIGRRPESDLLLDHWAVSRRHAYLQLIEGRFYCVDLGSRTGTLGGDVSERSGWLEEGRAIQIGPYAVRPQWPARQAPETAALPGVTWELPNRALGQALWRMDRNLVLVGRSQACRIRLIETDVSKFHCSLILNRFGVWVVDLLGQKGVFVNDEPVRFARLDDNDELRVGRHTLRPRYDTAPPALPADPATNSGPLAIQAGPPTELAVRVPYPPPMVRSRGSSWSGTGQELSPLVQEPGPLAELPAGAMMQQFSLMQQQMFDQFHQTMMMMFEGFAALHRETSGAVREEIEQVRKLSREIEDLRIETAKLTAAATARPPERPLPEPRPLRNGHGHTSADFGPTPKPTPAEPIKRANPPMPDPNVDIHQQLLMRLSTIQAERQNRWQKILGMMSSRS